MRLLDALRSLANQPRPPGARLLKGRLAGRWRIRVGGYRAIYAILEDRREIWVSKIGPRSSIYR